MVKIKSQIYKAWKLHKIISADFVAAIKLANKWSNWNEGTQRMRKGLGNS